MTENIEKRASVPRIILDLISAAFGIMLLELATGAICYLLLMKFTYTGSAVQETSYMYFGLGMTWVVAMIWMRFTKKNRPTIATLGPKSKGNRVPLLLLGFVIGFAMNGVCILAAVLHGDISIHFDSFQLFPMLLLFVAVFSQASAEEMICRGYYYQRAKRATGSAIAAVFLNAIAFAGCHVANSGVTFLALFNIVVIGVFYSLVVYYFDSIWCAFGMHTAWNYTQNIVFGLPNSGNVTPFSMFKLDGGAKDSFFYNVGFGVESTLFAVLIDFLAIAIVIVLGRRYKQKQQQAE